MSAPVFIEAGALGSEAYAIVREEQVGWVVVAVCPDRELAEAIYERLGKALPYVGLKDTKQAGNLFLRKCQVDP